MAYCGIVRERFAQLLDDPGGRGSVGHVEMKNTPLGVIDREPDVEDSEGRRGNGEEVHRRDRVAVVAKELDPTLERAGPWPLAGEILESVRSEMAMPSIRSSP